MTVRVGHIGFLNCYPLYYGLKHHGHVSGVGTSGRVGVPAVELVHGVPTELNRMLTEGEIDIGPISSIAYARNSDRLLLSRYLSISSFGAVDSIQLVTRIPLHEVRRVAVTSQSATSVTLLKTLLKLRYAQEATYTDLDGPLDAAFAQNDAVLVIGDQGLEALYFPTPGNECHDLGVLWREWTGLPMVYAVWAATEDFARSRPGDLLAVEAELVSCMDYGRQNLDEVVRAARGLSRFGESCLTRYFATLEYGFSPEYQDGLRRFYELAHEAGELEALPEFRFIDQVAMHAPAVGAARGVSS